MKRVAVIGGGINGVMIAWAFANEGYKVHLFEQNTLMSATSRASSKMLHGGIRYLELGHFGLVREALQERAWWLSQAPELTNQCELFIPVYQGVGRSKWMLRLGTLMYDLLAKGSGFPSGRWYEPTEVLSFFPGLKAQGLQGACSYWDGQMNDYELGLWAADQARMAGVYIQERTRVSYINSETGSVEAAGETREFDIVINATGPWAKDLLNQSAEKSEYYLDLVQGTHIVVEGSIDKGYVLQVPAEKRIVFVLPFQEKTLIGTTERKIKKPDMCMHTNAEIDYLLSVYNHYHLDQMTRADVVGVFSGARPIVGRTMNYSKASRESLLEKKGKLINVFGGKWTTSRSLAKSVLYLARQ